VKRGRILPAKKPEVSKAVAMMRERVQDHYGPDVDPLPLATIGLTQRAWRNAEAEGVHGGGTDRRISDGEMFAANVATTRLVLQNLRSFPAVDWDALANALVDSDRFAGRRTVSDLLGESYDEWVDTAHSVIATQRDMVSQYGPDFVLWFNVDSSIGSNWWGSPRWPRWVAAFTDGLTELPPGTNIEKLRRGLTDAPDAMDSKILDWCVSHRIRDTRV
jgi:hypothetical protein